MEHAVYDDIAREYKDSKQLPFRKYIEEYTLFQAAGNIRGYKVLDLACGEGFYTRKLKRARAAEVTGVDISPEMIHLAEASEFEKPLGCRYQVHDVAEMPTLGSFDMVVAMYLLNYARSKEELLAFCRAAYRQLEPGGRFIGFNDNMSNRMFYYETYGKYGFIKQTRPDRQEGDPIHYTFYNQDGAVFRFDNYYLHPETYAEAFAEAGFVDFRWTSIALHPSQKDNPFWNHFMAEPPLMGFSARKI